MPHSPTPLPARAPGRVRTVVRGLLALTALAALVVGTPVLLWALGTLPARIPSIGEARNALLSPDDSGSGLMTTMTVAAWTMWLWLTVPVLLEVAAVLARRTTPRLPGMSTGQRLAGYLIASVLLASPAAAAVAAPAAGPAATAPRTPAAAPISAPSPASSAPASPQQPDGATSAAAAPGIASYTVGAGGTTWWELAEELLGDGARYQELRTLNPGIPATVSVLPEGTTLRVPARSPASPAPSGIQPAAYSSPSATGDTTRSGQAAKVYTVRAGDSLSAIAARELGDAARWPALYTASRDRPQPHGLPRITNPDLIHPGQRVQMPQHVAQPSGNDAGDSRNPDRTSPIPPTHKSPPGPGGPGHDGPSASTSSPTPSRSPARTRAPGAQRTDPAPSESRSSLPTASSGSHTPDPAEQPSGASNRSTELRTTLGAFALLAAAVTGALATRRLLQRRRRKAGETIAIADAPSPAAAQLAELAEPTLSTRLDRALRSLARHAAEAGHTLPALRAARLNSDTLSVLPASQSPPLAPFTAGTGNWWILPDDAQLLTEEEARDVRAPYPALVTIGADEDTGDLILLNLAADRVLLLDGGEDGLRQVCRSLVLELGMSGWADRLEIVTVGFGEELTQLLPTSRIAHKRQAAHAVRDLADWLLTAVQIPEEADQHYLLVCASSLDADTAWQLAETLDKAASLPALLIAPAQSTGRHFADALVIDATTTSSQPLEGTEIQFVLQRLTDAAYQQIATDLAISGQPANPAEGAWQHVPDEPDAVAPPPAKPTGSAAAKVSVTDDGADTDPAGLDVFPALLSARPTPEPSGNPPPPSGKTRHGSDEPPAPAPPDGTENEPRFPAADQPPTPLLKVLGPVQITGVSGSSHGPREAQLAALLHFKPGRGADTLCTDMDPLAPWTKRTLNSRMGDLRRTLGDDPEGNPYVPRRTTSDDPYVISTLVRCDWDEFQQLAEHALALGPTGVDSLEAALALVRGRPFGSQPLPWAEPHAQEMTTRIIDVAHTVATYRTPAGPLHDLSTARQAVATGLDVDNSAELLYRDWLRIEHAAGNRQGLHTAVTRIQQVNLALDCSLETETEDLINQLLHNRTIRMPALRPRPQARTSSTRA
ncbi:LysM peptidoglycan-binding domain-containing protein [Streptomyces sp. AHU1]|uniref:LysM peptidoglycan-binding domain-containing protein n=1 Tax=Streptomyces sp. AHU1 TaxID=3377215 RepID=UPI00387843EE